MAQKWKRPGRPHVHPSETCYKIHRCRCPDCRALNTLARQRERAGIIITEPTTVRSRGRYTKKNEGETQ